MLARVAFQQLLFVILAYVSRCAANEARAAHCGVANGVIGGWLHKLNHHVDDVARRAELAVRAALGDFRKQVFVHVAHNVFVVQVELINFVDDFN